MSAYPLAMTDDAALPRRRSDNPHEETCHISFTDARIGTIGVRAGAPVHASNEAALLLVHREIHGWFARLVRSRSHRQSVAP